MGVNNSRFLFFVCVVCVFGVFGVFGLVEEREHGGALGVAVVER